MSRIYNTVLILIVIVADCYGRKPPYYVGQCSGRDDLNLCLTNLANKAIPFIVKGDYGHDIPNMTPLRLPEVVVRDDYNLRFILRNVKIYGLHCTEQISARLLPLYRSYEYNLTNPRITILGDYVMQGQILDAPINGAGIANITLVNGQYTHGFKYGVNEKNHVTIYYPYFKYRTNLNIYDFTELTMGNEFRGYQTNVFLNNNWKEVNDIFKKGFSRLFNNLLVTIFENIVFSASIDHIITP